jgi:adenylate cyclase
MEKPRRKKNVKCLRFRYYNQADTLFLDEQPLIKGMPAKLLIFMLRAYLATGKSLFFLSELRADRSLCIMGNLEARLERLAKRIESRVDWMRLVRQKGCRRLEFSIPVSLEEV